MKKNKSRIIFICLFLFIFFCTGLQAYVGFRVNNGWLYDGNGNQFVMYGISHAHCWYTDRTSALADIKRAGANTVRVVLSAGQHGEGWPKSEAADVQNIISICKSNRLVAMLECHDTTGYGEKSGAVSLATAVSYWREIKSVLDGEEDYVLINIGNEPYGNTNASAWVNDTRNAIQSMRSAGFDHTLVVDAPNWGQDWEHIMRDNAQSIYNADSTGNTMLSIHMYGVYKKDDTINSYIKTIKDQGLPLIIGEFGWDHSDGDPDEDSIMYRAVEYNIGYIGWSWCGNGGGVEYLDMVNNWNASSLSSWGDRIVNGANGLKSKAVECSIFGGGYQPPSTQPDPTQPPPSAGSCVNIPVWNANDVYDQTGTRVQYNGRVYQNNWYSKGENPEEYSNDNQVWTFIGVCDDGGTTNPPAETPPPSNPPTNPPAQTQVPSSVTGDVNGDGTINIVDALMVAQFYVGLSPDNFIQSRADSNCDGSINIVDALLIAQYYVGLVNGFDC
ncbi:MAG: cellulase family glycosylhydrolase [Spirochaetales bacterium]|nr:cellulase family glycosylhydrolase [Spirochaetales bacterium]